MFKKIQKWIFFALILTVFIRAGGNFTPVTEPIESIDSTPFIDSIGFSYGQSKDNIDIYRFTLRRDFKSRWFKSSSGYLSGYYEGSLNYWNGRGDTNLGIALSPVFAYYFNLSQEFKPYIEAGIGASLWSNTKMGPRDLTTSFLFEDRIGVGFRFKKIDLSFRYMHYSNGSIKQPNDGIDIFIASINYRF